MGDVTELHASNKAELIEVMEAMMTGVKDGSIESFIAVTNGEDGTFHYCIVRSDFADLNLEWDCMKSMLISEGMV